MQQGFVSEAEEIMSMGYQYKDYYEFKLAFMKFIENPDLAKTDNYNRIQKQYWPDRKGLEEIWSDIIQAIS